MKRLAVIGLDAAEPELVERMIAQGELPALARLREGGARCRLRSEATWRSGRVWETLLTGEADFPSAALFDPKNYASWQLGSRKKTPFYAQVPGLNVLALDVPYMSLWHDVPGVQVIWGGHDAGYPRASRPAGLVREIDTRFGVHPAFHNDFDCAWHDPRSLDTLADALIAGSRRRVEVLSWLHHKFPDWNLLLTVLSEAHSAGEMFWHGLVPADHPLAGQSTAEQAGRRLHEVYREVDRSVGQILATLPSDTTVLICSLHGMQANDYDVPSMAILPELLYRASLGRSLLHGPDVGAWRRRGCPPIFPRPDQKWHSYLQSCWPQSPLQRLRAAFSRLRPRKRTVHKLTKPIPPETTRAPEEIAEPRWKLDWQLTCRYRPYWPKMRAFALPVFYDGRVRINLRGRERDGIVEPGDYHATCDWVENLLAECRNVRDGRPVLAGIDRLRSTKPMATDGPDADLVITWNPAIDAIEHPQLGTIGPFPFRRTGGHTDRGFAYLAGPGIAARDCGEQERLDLTPTILGLLGNVTAKPSIFMPQRRAA